MNVLEKSDPIELFQDWYQSARASEAIRHPTAMCLSTASTLAEPDARFVDLKRFDSQGFVFTSYLSSPKSRAIESNPNVSLTFWWDVMGRQVRVRGRASVMDESSSDEFFTASRREAQLLILASRQSESLGSRSSLEERITDLRDKFEGKVIKRPDYWAAFLVSPREIEFLNLEADRIHFRKRYVLTDGVWTSQMLQP